jgi:hypothetical protein
MRKKKREVFKNISNKFAYTIITLCIMILLAIGVYAYGTSSPSVFGHSIGEVAPPTSCTANQVLTWTGSAWACTTASVNHAIAIYRAPISSTAILSCSSVDLIRNGKQPCAGQLVTLSPIGGCCFYVNSACQYNGTFGDCTLIGYLVN